jgi:hypothetical protein
MLKEKQSDPAKNIPTLDDDNIHLSKTVQEMKTPGGKIISNIGSLNNELLDESLETITQEDYNKRLKLLKEISKNASTIKLEV